MKNSNYEYKQLSNTADWLEAYGESHQNPINQKIHKVAVPGIYLS
ncbi:DUF962 domain-containing protein, partial [Vibrio parahaemolyticus]